MIDPIIEDARQCSVFGNLKTADTVVKMSAFDLFEYPLVKNRTPVQFDGESISGIDSLFGHAGSPPELHNIRS